MRRIVLQVFIGVSGACLLGGCQGPDDKRAPVRLHVDPNLLTTDFGADPRAEAASVAIDRAAKRYTAKIFSGSPMPSEVPKDEAQPVDIRLAELARLATPPRGAPKWSEGTEQPERNADDDVARPWTVRVKRGENLRLLAKWAGTTLQDLRAENRERLGSRRYARAGDKITLTLSANQKYAFDQARDKHQKERVANYFATRFVEKVVVYQVKRGDSILKAAKRYGNVPLWLLSEFNQRSFRRLRPNELILIPVVKRYERGQELPGQLLVVDENSQPLADTDAQVARQKMNADLLGRARVAIDDGNVFERRPIIAASHRPDPVLTNRPGLAPRMPAVGRVPTKQQPQPLVQGQPRRSWAPPAPAHAPAVSAVEPTNVAQPAGPVRRIRSVLVKKRETLGHYRAWSGLSTQQIKDANPGLNPDRIFIGKKLKLPMTDDAYAEFVQKRSEAFLSPREKARRAAQRAIVEKRAREAAALQARLKAQPGPKAAGMPRAVAGKPVVAAIRPASVPAAAGSPAPLASSSPSVPPAKRRFHTVSAGDTVSRIAKRWKVSLKTIKELNPGLNIEVVRLGATIRVR